MERFNDEQLLAIAKEGHVLLTACPGSGKTRVIIGKIADAVFKVGSSRKKVIALTYTVRAAEEIVKRLREGDVPEANVWAGTLHAFCIEWIISPYSYLINELNQGFSIADEGYCAELKARLHEKYGYGFTDKISFKFNRDGTFFEPHVAYHNLLDEYYSILSSKRLLDFESLLLASYKLLVKNQKISKVLSNIFHLICVDEYQDTQDLQYAIVCNIVKSGEGQTKLFIVGDVDQAIYTSLGGVAKTLGELEEEIGQPIAAMQLVGNYRSSSKIVDFYTAFKSSFGAVKAVGANAQKPGIITYNKDIHFKNIHVEVARLVRLNLNLGIPPEEIVIVVPQWWMASSIAKRLRVLLPDVQFDASGMSPMNKNRENVWYKISKLLLTDSNPKIYALRNTWSLEVVNDLQSILNRDLFSDGASERLLLKIVNSVRSEKTDAIEYLKECFEQITQRLEIDISESSLLVEKHKLFFDHIEKRLFDSEMEIPRDILSFKAFYREMAGVVISSCAGVKGEEYSTVIAFGLLVGYLPHWDDVFSKKRDNGRDASMKLMYVICSRAKLNLHLISETGRKTKTSNRLLEPNVELSSLKFKYDIL